jgi:hypothetical protein
MSKRNTDGVLETFKSYIQREKFERQKRECLQNVQLDDMHNHDSTIKLQGKSNSWNHSLYW